MMKFLVVLLAFFTTNTMAGKYLPASIEKEQTAFQQCNSFTLRYGLIIKVAEIGWYATNCQANKPLLDIGNKIVRFHYFKNVKADFFKQSAEEFFLKNLNHVEPQTDLIAALKSFNDGYTEIKPGEYFDLFHSDENQLSLFRNSELLVSTNNKTLAKNYFNIWFGEEPVVEKLKQAFLNQ